MRLSAACRVLFVLALAAGCTPGEDQDDGADDTTVDGSRDTDPSDAGDAVWDAFDWDDATWQ